MKIIIIFLAFLGGKKLLKELSKSLEILNERIKNAGN